MTDQGSTSGLLTSVETAERLGIDRGTLTRWVQTGRITPTMKLPGKNGPALFDPADVDALAAETQHSRRPTSSATGKPRTAA